MGFWNDVAGLGSCIGNGVVLFGALHMGKQERIEGNLQLSDVSIIGINVRTSVMAEICIG